MPKILLYIFFIFIGNTALAQRDTLIKKFDNSNADTNTLNQLVSDTKLLRKQGNYDDALWLIKKYKSYFIKVKSVRHLALYHSSIGLIYDYSGVSDSAIAHYKTSIKLFRQTGDNKNIAINYLNLGIVNMYKGDIESSLKYLLKTIKITRKYKLEDIEQVAILNIGGIYVGMDEYNKAHDYFIQNLNYSKKKGVDVAGNTYYNLGAIYMHHANTDSIEFYFSHALDAFEKEQDLLGMSDSKAGIAVAKRMKGNYEEAIKLYQESFNIKYKVHVAISPDVYFNAALCYAFHGDRNKSFAYLDSGLFQAKSMSNRKRMSEGYHSKAMVHELFGEYKEALKYLRRSEEIKDSILNNATRKEMEDMKLQHDLDLKEREVKQEERIKQEKQKIRLEAEAEQQNKRNRMIIFSVGAIALLIILFAIIIYRRFQVTQKQNRIIESQKAEVTYQKEIVEEKNKEIVDSINYAKRLQDAILPSDKHWYEQFSDSFVLYLPKDIVAGDFYWMETLGSEREQAAKEVLFAACDCTGHGVPGAMVSVVCSNALDRSVNEFGLRKPAGILDKATDLVIERFIKYGNEVKDGMDISLCLLRRNDKGKYELEWAGANNPLWIIRNNELIEFKPDKQPVGMYFERKKFTNHKIELFPGDQLYIMSDGYADQFGGEKGKKYKESVLKKFLLSVHEEKMSGQKEKLLKEFRNWKGEMDQIDDVCIIGVQI